MSVPRLSSAVELAHRFEGLLVDLWGVVHDGETLFDGVRDALLAIADRGARIVFLSNTSRLGEDVAESLVKMGLPRESFEGVVSSGDVTRGVLRARAPEVFGRLPASPKVLHLGDAGYVPWLQETGLTFTDDEATADLVVASGAAEDERTLRAITARLEALAGKNVPLVCTNPDRFIPSKRGLRLGPGAVAHAYRALGGPTFLYGKPHPPIYRAALARLGMPAERVAAVGDMLETDIAGARATGIHAVLVLSGVHRDVLGEAPTDAELEALFAREGVRPDAVVSRLAV